jgi:hypothetical protein
VDRGGSKNELAIGRYEEGAVRIAVTARLQVRASPGIAVRALQFALVHVRLSRSRAYASGFL